MENFSINLENLNPEEKEQLFSLVEKSNKPNPNKRWRADYGECYYTIFGDGDIAPLCENNQSEAKLRYKLGNYFKTRQEAGFEREKRLLYQELSDYAFQHNEKELNWDDATQEKFCIYLAHKPDSSTVLAIDNMQTVEYPNTVYFSSREIAKNAIKAIGEERIKKYLFS